MATLHNISSVYGKVSAVNRIPHKKTHDMVHVCGMSFPLVTGRGWIVNGKHGYPKVMVIYEAPQEGHAITERSVVAVLRNPRRPTWLMVQRAISEGSLTEEMLDEMIATIYRRLH